MQLSLPLDCNCTFFVFWAGPCPELRFVLSVNLIIHGRKWSVFRNGLLCEVVRYQVSTVSITIAEKKIKELILHGLRKANLPTSSCYPP